MHKFEPNGTAYIISEYFWLWKIFIQYTIDVFNTRYYVTRRYKDLKQIIKTFSKRQLLMSILNWGLLCQKYNMKTIG